MLRARVPRYQLAMLRHMAQRESTTVSAVLTRELEDVTCAHADTLPHAIPGFSAALAWPFGSDTQEAC